MPSQIEARIGKLEQQMGAGSCRIVVLFEEDDDLVVPEGTMVVRVIFGKSGGRDAQEAG